MQFTRSEKLATATPTPTASVLVQGVNASHSRSSVGLPETPSSETLQKLSEFNLTHSLETICASFTVPFYAQALVSAVVWLHHSCLHIHLMNNW